MEILNFEFNAGKVPQKSIVVGCVGSGDLEIRWNPVQKESLKSG